MQKSCIRSDLSEQPVQPARCNRRPRLAAHRLSNQRISRWRWRGG